MTEAVGRCYRLEVDSVRRTSFSVHMKRRVIALAVDMSRGWTVGDRTDLTLSLRSNSSFRCRTDALRQVERSDKVRFRIVPC